MSSRPRRVEERHEGENKDEKGTRGEGRMGEVKGFREHISENTEVTAQMLRAGVNAEGGQWDRRAGTE